MAKTSFFLQFLLTFLVFPSFINMETMELEVWILENADTYEDEVSLNIDEKVGMPDDQQNVQRANNETDQQENHKTNHAAVSETNQEEKIVYLTFDDEVPTDSLTNMLDILAEYDVQKATFFMLEPLMSCHVNISRMNQRCARITWG